MSVRTTKELLAQVKDIIGDDTSDNALNLLSDISDTMDDLTKKKDGDGVDWKKKYEDNDAEWRKKYKERFFAPVDKNTGKEDETDDDTNEDDVPKLKDNFDDLFMKGDN